MLTQKDFKAVAEIIQQNQPLDPLQNDYCTGKADALGYVTDELANYFATQNPQFDRNRFMQACGLTE